MAADRDRPRIYEPNARLISARLRKYETPEDAARALGVPSPTYRAHENGSRGVSRSAERYARFFGVSLDWLLSGRGEMTGAPMIDVHGRIGTGATVTMNGEAENVSAHGNGVRLPMPADCWAFAVEGDSMRPRFYAGEIVVFERKPSPEAELVGLYVLAELHPGGERFVKILRASERAGRWRLDSHNAEPMENVELRAAYRWRATLPPRDR